MAGTLLELWPSLVFVSCIVLLIIILTNEYRTTSILRNLSTTNTSKPFIQRIYTHLNKYSIMHKELRLKTRLSEEEADPSGKEILPQSRKPNIHQYRKNQVVATGMSNNINNNINTTPKYPNQNLMKQFVDYDLHRTNRTPKESSQHQQYQSQSVQGMRSNSEQSKFSRSPSNLMRDGSPALTIYTSMHLKTPLPTENTQLLLRTLFRYEMRRFHSIYAIIEMYFVRRIYKSIRNIESSSRIYCTHPIYDLNAPTHAFQLTAYILSTLLIVYLQIQLNLTTASPLLTISVICFVLFVVNMLLLYFERVLQTKEYLRADASFQTLESKLKEKFSLSPQDFPQEKETQKNNSNNNNRNSQQRPQIGQSFYFCGTFSTPSLQAQAKDEVIKTIKEEQFNSKRILISNIILAFSFLIAATGIYFLFQSISNNTVNLTIQFALIYGSAIIADFMVLRVIICGIYTLISFTQLHAITQNQTEILDRQQQFFDEIQKRYAWENQELEKLANLISANNADKTRIAHLKEAERIPQLSRSRLGQSHVSNVYQVERESIRKITSPQHQHRKSNSPQIGIHAAVEQEGEIVDRYFQSNKNTKHERVNSHESRQPKAQQTHHLKETSIELQQFTQSDQSERNYIPAKKIHPLIIPRTIQAEQLKKIPRYATAAAVAAEEEFEHQQDDFAAGPSTNSQGISTNKNSTHSSFSLVGENKETSIDSADSGLNKITELGPKIKYQYELRYQNDEYQYTDQQVEQIIQRAQYSNKQKGLYKQIHTNQSTELTPQNSTEIIPSKDSTRSHKIRRSLDQEVLEYKKRNKINLESSIPAHNRNEDMFNNSIQPLRNTKNGVNDVNRSQQSIDFSQHEIDMSQFQDHSITMSVEKNKTQPNSENNHQSIIDINDIIGASIFPKNSHRENISLPSTKAALQNNNLQIHNKLENQRIAKQAYQPPAYQSQQLSNNNFSNKLRGSVQPPRISNLIIHPPANSPSDPSLSNRNNCGLSSTKSQIASTDSKPIVIATYSPSAQYPLTQTDRSMTLQNSINQNSSNIILNEVRNEGSQKQIGSANYSPMEQKSSQRFSLTPNSDAHEQTLSINEKNQRIKVHALDSVKKCLDYGPNSNSNNSFQNHFLDPTSFNDTRRSRPKSSRSITPISSAQQFIKDKENVGQQIRPTKGTASHPLSTPLSVLSQNQQENQTRISTLPFKKQLTSSSTSKQQPHLGDDLFEQSIDREIQNTKSTGQNSRSSSDQLSVSSLRQNSINSLINNNNNPTYPHKVLPTSTGNNVGKANSQNKTGKPPLSLNNHILNNPKSLLLNEINAPSTTKSFSRWSSEESQDGLTSKSNQINRISLEGYYDRSREGISIKPNHPDFIHISNSDHQQGASKDIIHQFDLDAHLDPYKSSQGSKQK